MANGRAKKIYGGVLAAAGLGVFVAAVGLAVAANEGPTAAPKEKLVLPRGKRRHKRPRRPQARKMPAINKTSTVRAPRPRKQGVGLGSKTERSALRPRIPINAGPTAMPRPVGLPGNRVDTIKKIGPALRGYPTAAPLMKPLSPEEREKRRQERKQRQLDTLVRRIQSLEARIDRAKEGGRSPRAIERMEQSLERMKQRRKKLEDALQEDR